MGKNRCTFSLSFLKIYYLKMLKNVVATYYKECGYNCFAYFIFSLYCFLFFAMSFAVSSQLPKQDVDYNHTSVFLNLFPPVAPFPKLFSPVAHLFCDLLAVKKIPTGL